MTEASTPILSSTKLSPEQRQLLRHAIADALRVGRHVQLEAREHESRRRSIRCAHAIQRCHLPAGRGILTPSEAQRAIPALPPIQESTFSGGSTDEGLYLRVELEAYARESVLYALAFADFLAPGTLSAPAGVSLEHIQGASLSEVGQAQALEQQHRAIHGTLIEWFEEGVILESQTRPGMGLRLLSAEQQCVIQVILSEALFLGRGTEANHHVFADGLAENCALQIATCHDRLGEAVHHDHQSEFLTPGLPPAPAPRFSTDGLAHAPFYTEADLYTYGDRAAYAALRAFGFPHLANAPG